MGAAGSIARWMTPGYRPGMTRRYLSLVAGLSLALPSPSPAQTVANVRGANRAAFDSLVSQFWRWRRDQQPTTPDDIPRYERDTAWVPRWDVSDISAARARAQLFLRQWKSIDTVAWNVPQQVDFRLMGSAIQRVGWELDCLRLPERDARFWVQQTLGSVHDALLPPPAIENANSRAMGAVVGFDGIRARALRRRLERIPLTVEHAKNGLTTPVRAFADLAITQLTDVDSRLATVTRELTPLLPARDVASIAEAAAEAGRALVELRRWLEARREGMRTRVAAGPEAYAWFLREVALVPFAPDQLLAMGRQEWARAVAGEVTERQKNAALPELPYFADAASQVEQERRDELAVREWLDAKALLSVPATLRHYVNRRIPAYLDPIASMGVNVDHTSETRLAQDGVAAIWDPSPTLGYFGRAIARDPRPIVVHEGVPGHYMQLAMGWRHPNPVRRRYYDSGPNEGLGFYAEEMMMTAGLFDDRPRVREVIWNFMRLRALRVEVDVRLATGDMSVLDAWRYLRVRVPMDSTTAMDEAASFAGGPAQAITYTIGKLQITRLLAERREQLGAQFVLRDFHDYLWRNGNVPIALLRWELTGAYDEVARLGSNGGPPPVVR